MPANLPPQYFEAEKTYRLAKSIPERIEALENMLAIMPKHKGTDKLRAELRARIAKLSEEAQRRPALSKKGQAYNIRREGAGQVALVGLPNSGKSQLLACLTEALPRIADYPFTTQSPMPGMMKFENIQIQVIDMPSVNDGDARPWLYAVLRSADLLLVVIDLGGDTGEQVKAIFDELAQLHIKPIGRLGEDRSQLGVPKKVLIVGNKGDLEVASGSNRRLELEWGGEFPVVCLSAKMGAGIDELKRAIFSALDIIRVYTKTPGEEPDLNDPVILKRGSTIEDVAEAIHKDLRHRLKFAQIWGSGKFSGQRVQRRYSPQDGDIVELHA